MNDSTSTGTAGRNSRAVTITRVVGHASWWIFVVTALSRVLPESGSRRYADYVEMDASFVGGSTISDGFGEQNALATAAMIAVAVTVIAGVVEAFLSRKWPAGTLTILTPIVGGALVWVAVEARSGDVWHDVFLRPSLVVAMVLLGVAIREVWSRGFAPGARR